MGVSWGWDYDTPPRGVTCANVPEGSDFPKIDRFFQAIWLFFFRFLFYAVFLTFSFGLHAKKGVYLLTDTLPSAILAITAVGAAV